MLSEKNGRKVGLNIKTNSVQHWLNHLTFFTVSEHHNLLHHSSMTKNIRSGVLHITRNHFVIYINSQRNYEKLSEIVKTMLQHNDTKVIPLYVSRMLRNVTGSLECFKHTMQTGTSVTDKTMLNINSKIQKSASQIRDFSRFLLTEERSNSPCIIPNILSAIDEMSKHVNSLFFYLMYETCKAVLHFIKSCASDLLKRTVVQELCNHISKNCSEMFTDSLVRANVVPFLLKCPSRLFYDTLYLLCLKNDNACLEAGSHNDFILNVLTEVSQDEYVRLSALKLLSRLTSLLSLGSIQHKPESQTLMEIIPSVVRISIRQMCSMVTKISEQISGSVLEILINVASINRECESNGIDLDVTLVESINPLLTKLETDELSIRNLEMVVKYLSLLTSRVICKESMQEQAVVQVLFQVLNATQNKWTLLSNAMNQIDSRHRVSSASNVSLSQSSSSRNSMSSVSTESSKTFPERTQKRVTWASDSDLACPGSRSLTTSSEFLSSESAIKSAIRVKRSGFDKMSQDYEMFGQHEKLNDSEKMDNSRQKQLFESVLQKCIATISCITLTDVDKTLLEYLSKCGAVQVLLDIMYSHDANEVLLAALSLLRELASAEIISTENWWKQNKYCV